MGRRSGSAVLPLHGGRVPHWLAARMARLGRVIVEAIVLEYGRDELLRRLAHPFWFQSFGAVMGMDWHSSGITTSVIGALERGLEPVADELDLHVCGGHPFPVPLRIYDETLRVLRRAVDGARLGNDDRLASLRRLDQAARAVDAAASGGPSFADFVARERRRAPDYGGVTVFGPATGRRAGSRAKPRKDRSRRPRSDQLELPGVDE